MVLAGGQRAGFFIGDGAGVGKGRQVRHWQISNPSNVDEPCTLFNGLTYNTPWYFAHIFPSPRSEEKYEQWAKIVSEYYVLTNHWIRDLFFHFYASFWYFSIYTTSPKNYTDLRRHLQMVKAVQCGLIFCVSLWPRN